MKLFYITFHRGRNDMKFRLGGSLRKTVHSIKSNHFCFDEINARTNVFFPVISFRVVFWWHFIARNEVSFLSKWPQWVSFRVVSCKQLQEVDEKLKWKYFICPEMKSHVNATFQTFWRRLMPLIVLNLTKLIKGNCDIFSDLLNFNLGISTWTCLNILKNAEVKPGLIKFLEHIISKYSMPFYLISEIIHSR